MTTRRTSPADDKIIVLFAPAADDHRESRPAPTPRRRRRSGPDWYALGVLLLLVTSAVASFHSLAGAARTLPGVAARPVAAPVTAREAGPLRRPLLSRPLVESDAATFAPAGRKI